MSQVVSIHVADAGKAQAPRLLARPPALDGMGLLNAHLAAAAPLRQSPWPPIALGRVALVALWRDEAAARRFLESSGVATAFAQGWYALLEPLRCFGAWPGLDDDLPRGRATDYDGPAVALTLGWLRLRQTMRFLRVSGRAERAAVDAPGFVWGTGIARPPFVATCSLWASTGDLARYAYGGGAHDEAIDADRAKAFHHRSAFVRFRPIATGGTLGGRNPLTAEQVGVLRVKRDDEASA